MGTLIRSIQLMKTGVMRVRGITWSNGERDRENDKMGQLYKLGGMTSLINGFVLNHNHNHVQWRFELEWPLITHPISSPGFLYSLLACLPPQFDMSPKTFRTH